MLRIVAGRKELGQCDISLVAELWVPRASFAPTHFHLQLQLSTTASNLTVPFVSPFKTNACSFILANDVM